MTEFHWVCSVAGSAHHLSTFSAMPERGGETMEVGGPARFRYPCSKCILRLCARNEKCGMEYDGKTMENSHIPVCSPGVSIIRDRLHVAQTAPGTPATAPRTLFELAHSPFGWGQSQNLEIFQTFDSGSRIVLSKQVSAVDFSQIHGYSWRNVKNCVGQ